MSIAPISDLKMGRCRPHPIKRSAAKGIALFTVACSTIKYTSDAMNLLTVRKTRASKALRGAVCAIAEVTKLGVAKLLMSPSCPIVPIGERLRQYSHALVVRQSDHGNTSVIVKSRASSDQIDHFPSERQEPSSNQTSI